MHKVCSFKGMRNIHYVRRCFWMADSVVRKNEINWYSLKISSFHLPIEWLARITQLRAKYCERQNKKKECMATTQNDVSERMRMLRRTKQGRTAWWVVETSSRRLQSCGTLDYIGPWVQYLASLRTPIFRLVSSPQFPVNTYFILRKKVLQIAYCFIFDY